VTRRLSALPASPRPSDGLIDTAGDLDKHHVGPRYPDSCPEGAPLDFYTRGEAERAALGAIPAFLPGECPVGIDVFPYTSTEIEWMKVEGNPFGLGALRDGAVVFRRSGATEAARG